MASTARLRWRRRILFIIHQGGPVCRGRWGSCAQQRDFQGFVVFLLATTGGRTGAVTRCMGSRGRRVVRLPTLLAAALKSLPPGAPPRKSTAQSQPENNSTPQRRRRPTKKRSSSSSSPPSGCRSLETGQPAVVVNIFREAKKRKPPENRRHIRKFVPLVRQLRNSQQLFVYTSSSSVSKSFAPLQYFEPFTRVPLS